MNEGKEENERGTFLVFTSYGNSNDKDGECTAGRSTSIIKKRLLQNNDTARAVMPVSASWSSPSLPTYIHCNSKSQFVLPSSSDHDNNNDGDDSDVPSIIGASTHARTSYYAEESRHVIKIPIYRRSSSSLSTSSTNTCTITDTHTDVNIDSSRNSCPNSYAKHVNSTLNLHLGLPFNPRNVKIIRWVCTILSYVLSLVEDFIFEKWDTCIPLKLRQSITHKAWNIYYPIHKYLLSNKTAIHPNASYQYHAITSLLYWGRLFPVTIKRMRFSLSQLHCCHDEFVYPISKNIVVTKNSNDDDDEEDSQLQQQNLSSLFGLKATYLHSINYDMINNNIPTTATTTITSTAITKQRFLSTPFMRCNAPFTTNASNTPIKTDPSCVTGYIIQHHPKPSSKIILWLYGGAYLGGNSSGNLHYAEKISQNCSYTDVFLPNYRLLPEYTFFDALYDVCLSYEYLILVKGYHPKNIILFGISSGGGLCVRLMQRIVEFQMEIKKKEKEENEMIHTNEEQNMVELLTIVPRGAVLMSPFVDYTEPKGSFQEYTQHDLIVNESVFEEGLPYLSTLGSHENSKRESPVYKSFVGLPPLCLITSEHECVFDQNIMLCNNARRDGVDVDLGLWKYMCHVWPVWSGFLPEARQAVDFICDWINHE